MIPPSASISRTRCPFRDSADRRIARHLSDEIEVQRDQPGFRTESSRGRGGLAARMAGADHDYIEYLVE